jgi:hypothetical protein
MAESRRDGTIDFGWIHEADRGLNVLCRPEPPQQQSCRGPRLRDSRGVVGHGSRHSRAGLLIVTSLKGLVQIPIEWAHSRFKRTTSRPLARLIVKKVLF